MSSVLKMILALSVSSAMLVSAAAVCDPAQALCYLLQTLSSGSPAAIAALKIAPNAQAYVWAPFAAPYVLCTS